MIKHIVLWKINDKLDKVETGLQLKEKLESLSAQIPELKMLEVGLNFNDADTAADVSLYTAFDSREDLQTYQKHPAHVEVAGFVKSVAKERRVSDYETV